MFKASKISKLIISILLALFAVTMFSSTVQAKGTQKPGSGNPPVISEGASYSLTIDEDTSQTILFNAKDSDRNDALTWSISAAPLNGTAVIKNTVKITGGSRVAVAYTPNPNYNGSDQFTVQVKDSKGNSDTITVAVYINPVYDRVISYVALGDSIATGTIYPGASITSYVTYFYQYLIQQNPGTNVTMKNLAADGSRSNELYTKLGIADQLTADANMVSAVIGADIITISIGGNNLMQAAKDSSALGGYNFNQFNTSLAEQGVQDFNNHWVPIINKIKELNPDVLIIVNTLYNPYNEADAALHNAVDSYLFRSTEAEVKGINDVILNSAGLGYLIADVYGAFNQYSTNMGAITYFYPGPLDFWGQLTRNPHPNTSGQYIITALVKSNYVPLN
jgi:lysophospholipase L1-like esterase